MEEAPTEAEIEAQVAHVARLRRAVLTADPADLRAAFDRLPEATFRALAASAGQPHVILRRSADPAARLRRMPDDTQLAALAEALVGPCLEDTVEVLGEASDEPTYNQLMAALDDVAERHTPHAVATMLAYVAATGQPASGHCARILDEDERFPVADEAESAAGAATSATAGPVPAPIPPPGRGASPERKEARQARRQREREERKAEASRAARAAEALRQRKQAKSTAEREAAEPGSDRTARPAAAPRREVPAWALGDDFSPGDPLTGAVVTAEIVFEGPTDGAKVRPCVVVAGSADSLLLRPCYSEGGVRSRDWRSVEVLDWWQAGMTKPGWVENDLRAVHRDQVGEVIGRLTDQDWNRLW
ncbi:MAG TPA: hypothetical protein VM030_08420 [Acidimicrobiales bacterium]|nr:hypothetical protein [Acidimicrobiales bacterium]